MTQAPSPRGAASARVCPWTRTPRSPWEPRRRPSTVPAVPASGTGRDAGDEERLATGHPRHRAAGRARRHRAVPGGGPPVLHARLPRGQWQRDARPVARERGPRHQRCQRPARSLPGACREHRAGGRVQGLYRPAAEIRCWTSRASTRSPRSSSSASTGSCVATRTCCRSARSCASRRRISPARHPRRRRSRRVCAGWPAGGARGLATPRWP